MIYPDRVDVWVPRIEGTTSTGADRYVWTLVVNVPAAVTPLDSSEMIDSFQERVVSRYRVILKPIRALRELAPHLDSQVIVSWGAYKAKASAA